MNNQRIAIPTAEGQLWPHFGKAPQVTFVTVEDGKVTETVVKQAPEHEHGAMPRFLAAEGCTDVVCGGIGGGAVQLLNQLGITLHGGAPTMPVDEIVSRYLAGTLIYGDATCHHDGCGEHHHELDTDLRQFCTNVGLPYVRNDDSVRSKHGQDGEVAEAD